MAKRFIDACQANASHDNDGLLFNTCKQVEEEVRRLRELTDKHQQELSALEVASTQEYDRFAKEWEMRLTSLTANISDQEAL